MKKPASVKSRIVSSDTCRSAMALASRSRKTGTNSRARRISSAALEALSPAPGSAQAAISLVALCITDVSFPSYVTACPNSTVVAVRFVKPQLSTVGLLLIRITRRCLYIPSIPAFTLTKHADLCGLGPTNQRSNAVSISQQ
ncbi:exported hypothetical protein [Novosphingobium sp. KN65.2]|nr:exported hypothetical protein [Novosphingobium sp. KN65.2]